MKFVWCLLLTLLAGRVAAAEKPLHYTFTPACAEAYAAIVELRLDEGRESLAALRRKDPSNLVPLWLEDYADFLQVYIDEDEADFKRLERSYKERLAKLDEGPKSSPYHRYTQANIMLHWALVRLKFGEYFTTIREMRRAYKLLEANLEEFPEFALTRKELGILQAAVATVPEGYQWGVELITGTEGDLEGGKRHLEQLLTELRATDSPFLQETTAIYAFLLLNFEREGEAAWSRINAAGFDESRSLLGAFIKANIAMRTGRNDEAIRLLEARPHSPRYYPFAYLDFMLGVCLQRKLDPTASVYLASFVQRKGEGNFIKEAHQKLSWCALLGDERYDFDKQQAFAKTRGLAVVGSDKNALREAESGVRPNPGLLRARLLYDGGYYERATEAIASVRQTDLRGEQTIELPYRAARIAAARDDSATAEREYKRTISVGRDSEAYFACKAAVELGALSAEAGRPAEARAYYELALSLRPSEYGPGLHQQAKAGLARLRRAGL